MNGHFTYTLVDASCVSIPLLFSFHPRIRFYQEWRYFALPWLLTTLLFVCWDIGFTFLGVWHFNRELILGPSLAGLPLEEYLFFFCIPFASLFTWFCVFKYYPLLMFRKTAAMLSGFLGVVLLVAGIVFCSRAYTLSTFGALGAVLVILAINKPAFLPSFFVSYSLILVPFFFANGILTGEFMSAPVVLYNNCQNMGIRMGTIPAEDTAYGMLLLLLPVAGYSFQKNKRVR